MDNDKNKHGVVDEDLYEEIDEDELNELVETERQKALDRAHQETNKKPKRPFPKWAFWLIAAAMLFNVVALIPKTFSIPAIEFLITSAKLSTQENIQTYKKAVVVIETGESKGTGFAVSGDGTIITNYHVVEGEKSVTVAFPDNGLFSAEVVDKYPAIDLAVLDVEEKGLPHLKLADKTTFNPDTPIYFIGNPLSFNGIANKGTIIDFINLSGWKKPVVMIDAPVYNGNSGSPVINGDGKVIGVVFATLNHDSQGKVGLFIPIDYYLERRDS